MPLAMIDISLIDHGTRLRDVSEAQVASLVESIAEVGLLNPITVYERPVVRGNNTVAGYGIIAGAHRKVACDRLGLTEIEANVVALSELQRQIAECDENLRGPHLGKADLAMFTRRRKEAYEALHPETRNGVIGATARHAPAKLADASFTADTAAATGRSERAVQRDAERGEKVADEVLSLIRDTALDTGAYLDKIKKLAPGEQIQAAKRDLGRPQSATRNSRGAGTRNPLSEQGVQDKQVDRLMSAWNAASAEARDAFLALIDAPVMGATKWRVA